jgi:predicted lipoprotein with Yx(FWY)xxD motif
MKRLLIPGAVVAVALVVFVLAGCGGGGDGGGSGMSSSGASASSNGGATVSAEQVGDAGKVLVDSTGHALYANDQEKKRGMVLCDGACLSFWTPLTTSSGTPKGDSLPGKLGVVTRPDGDKQVTYNGKLLYTFYLDEPGKVGGDGFDDAFGGKQFTWHVVHGDNSGSSPSPATQQPDDRGYPGS